jgi:hypothetical protein
VRFHCALPEKNSVTTTLNDEVQEQFQFQADYVLPIGEGGQFGKQRKLQ